VAATRWLERSRRGYLFRAIRKDQEAAVAVLLIEQNVERALGLAHRGFVLESGRTVLEGRSVDLLRSADLRKVFLGG
jgi:branched-chain amino acid transport system ATP-binding protein